MLNAVYNSIHIYSANAQLPFDILWQHNIRGLSSEPDALWTTHIIISLSSKFSCIFLAHAVCLANLMVTLDYLSIWFYKQRAYHSWIVVREIHIYLSFWKQEHTERNEMWKRISLISRDLCTLATLQVCLVLQMQNPSKCCCVLFWQRELFAVLDIEADKVIPFTSKQESLHHPPSGSVMLKILSGLYVEYEHLSSIVMSTSSYVISSCK